MILSDLSKCDAITRPYFSHFQYKSSSSGVNDITITKDLVNNTHSWSRPTRRWTRNSSRCCTSTDWICSNLSFRIETPDTSRNCPILQSKSRRNRCHYPICQQRQNCTDKHNIIITNLFSSIRRAAGCYFVCLFNYHIYIYSDGSVGGTCNFVISDSLSEVLRWCIFFKFVLCPWFFFRVETSSGLDRVVLTQFPVRN